ncbi:Sel1 repeat family protein, partial [Cryptosporidium felis]
MKRMGFAPRNVHVKAGQLRENNGLRLALLSVFLSFCFLLWSGSCTEKSIQASNVTESFNSGDLLEKQREREKQLGDGSGLDPGSSSSSSSSQTPGSAPASGSAPAVGEKEFDDESDEEMEGGEDSDYLPGGRQDQGKESAAKNTTLEDEIEIVRSRIFNSSFRLEKFYAKSVYDRLFEMFEPASEKEVNFLEIGKNLTGVIDTSMSRSNIADAYGVLTYLWFYGIPDKKGRLEFPRGWPRNIDVALRYALKGATKFNCGFCYSMMGLLFAWGYPPLVNNTHGWMGSENSTSKLDLLGSSGYKNTYFLYQAPYKYGNHMDQDRLNFPVEKSGFDLVSMNYALASKHKDVFGQLASSYYLRYSLSEMSYQYTDLDNSSGFSLHRAPRNLTSIIGFSPSSSSRCIMALEPLIFVASKTLGDSRDLFLPEISTLLRENKPKEHETRHYAEWVKSLAADRDPEGMTSLGELYYYGHEAGGIGRDVNRAAALWEESARRGDPQGALARAFLNLDGTMGTEADSAPYLRQVARYGEPPAAALANYYIYKLGLDVEKNTTIAGEYLKLAADLGDGNAQLILAHAYAGGNMGVVPPGGQNETQALKYYKLSAEGGRTVAYFNSAVLTLKGSDKKYKTEEARCVASMDYLTHVIRKNNHVRLLSLLSRKSFENGDIVGSLLREMTLSELGILEGHVNSQDLWKERSIRQLREALRKEGAAGHRGDAPGERQPVCKALELPSEAEGITPDAFSKPAVCSIVSRDESDERFSTLFPSPFEMEMSGLSSKSFCLARTNRRSIFFNVAINFDRSLLRVKSLHFKFFDVFNSQNATLRGDLDVQYSRNLSPKEKRRVSEFLGCWMRPQSYYDERNSALMDGLLRKNLWQEGDKDSETRSEVELGPKRDSGASSEWDPDSDLGPDLEQEESSVFDRLLEMWQRPRNGSHRRYPKPWYRILAWLSGKFAYLGESAFLRRIGERCRRLSLLLGLERPFPGLFGFDWEPEDYTRLSESAWELSNSSLWCSHYYFKRSSSNGDIPSTQGLVQQFLEGSFGVKRDPVSAFNYIMQGVNSRDPKSILDYAIALNKGIGTRRDRPKSYRLLWHLITRGPFNVEDILPRVPSGPKFVPTILDTIRDSIIPLVRNNRTDSAKPGSQNVQRQKKGGDSEPEPGRAGGGDEEAHPEKGLEEQEELEGEQGHLGEKKHRRGRRSRMSDASQMNLKTQQDFATRVSSLSVLAILTCDWVYYNVVLHYYYSSVSLKNQILSFFGREPAERVDSAGSDQGGRVEEAAVDGGACLVNGLPRSEIYCELRRRALSGALGKDDRGAGESFASSSSPAAGLEETGARLLGDLTLLLDEDPFPLSSRFRYVSDDDYRRASDFWGASLSIRLHHPALRSLASAARDGDGAPGYGEEQLVELGRPPVDDDVSRVGHFVLGALRAGAVPGPARLGAPGGAGGDGGFGRTGRHGAAVPEVDLTEQGDVFRVGEVGKVSSELELGEPGVLELRDEGDEAVVVKGAVRARNEGDSFVSERESRLREVQQRGVLVSGEDEGESRGQLLLGDGVELGNDEVEGAAVDEVLDSAGARGVRPQVLRGGVARALAPEDLGDELDQDKLGTKVEEGRGNGGQREAQSGKEGVAEDQGLDPVGELLREDDPQVASQVAPEQVHGLESQVSQEEREGPAPVGDILADRVLHRNHAVTFGQEVLDQNEVLAGSARYAVQNYEAVRAPARALGKLRVGGLGAKPLELGPVLLGKPLDSRSGVKAVVAALGAARTAVYPRPDSVVVGSAGPLQRVGLNELPELLSQGSLHCWAFLPSRAVSGALQVCASPKNAEDPQACSQRGRALASSRAAPLPWTQTRPAR